LKNLKLRRIKLEKAREGLTKKKSIGQEKQPKERQGKGEPHLTWEKSRTSSPRVGGGDQNYQETALNEEKKRRRKEPIQTSVPGHSRNGEDCTANQKKGVYEGESKQNERERK